MQENVENPLRCPVRLYEFYLSKWQAVDLIPNSVLRIPRFVALAHEYRIKHGKACCFIRYNHRQGDATGPDL